MAVQVANLFVPVVLTTSAANIYVAPATPTSLIVARIRVRFSNTSNASVSVTAYAIPTGGTALASNECLPGVAIAANAYLDVDIPVLAPGGAFAAMATAATSITVAQLDGVIFS
jgi:hypothetical protein